MIKFDLILSIKIKQSNFDHCTQFTNGNVPCLQCVPCVFAYRMSVFYFPLKSMHFNNININLSPRRNRCVLFPVHPKWTRWMSAVIIILSKIMSGVLKCYLSSQQAIRHGNLAALLILHPLL